MVTVKNKFNTPQETSERPTSNDEYENTFTPNLEAAVEDRAPNPWAKYRIPWKWIAVKLKQDYIKKVPLLNKRNPTKTKSQKIKKAWNELTHTSKHMKNTLRTKSIKPETR